MPKFAIAAAALGLMLAAPTFIAAAQANTPSDPQASYRVAQVDVRIGGPRRDRRWHRDRRCETKVIYRHGRKTVIKKCG